MNISHSRCKVSGSIARRSNARAAAAGAAAAEGARRLISHTRYALNERVVLAQQRTAAGSILHPNVAAIE